MSGGFGMGTKSGKIRSSKQVEPLYYDESDSKQGSNSVRSSFKIDERSQEDYVNSSHSSQRHYDYDD